MKKRILKTLKAYLITNEDVLEQKEIEDIKEQIKTVENFNTIKTYNDIGKSFKNQLEVYLYNLEYYSPTEDEKALLNDIKELIKNRGVEL